MVNVYIKGVDAEAYKYAKILAIRRDETVGNIVSEALRFIYSEETRPANNLANALGFLGKDNAALARERKEMKKIRKKTDEAFEARRRRYERLGYFPAD